MIQRYPSSPVTRLLRQTLLVSAPSLLCAIIVTAGGCSGDPAPPPGGGTVTSGGAAATSGGATSGGAMATSGGAVATSGGAMATSGGAVGSGGAGGAMGAAVPQCVTDTLKAQCLVCHGTMTAQFFGGLILEGNFVPNLVDKPAQYKSLTDTSACKQGALLIDSNNPAESVMLKKIMGTQACGAVMPNNGVVLPTAQKDCLTQWIMTF